LLKCPSPSFFFGLALDTFRPSRPHFRSVSPVSAKAHFSTLFPFDHPGFSSPHSLWFMYTSHLRSADLVFFFSTPVLRRSLSLFFCSSLIHPPWTPEDFHAADHTSFRQGSCCVLFPPRFRPDLVCVYLCTLFFSPLKLFSSFWFSPATPRPRSN